MNTFLAVILTAFLALFVGQVSATTKTYSSPSIDSLNSSMVCAEEKKKKKKEKEDGLPEEKEPECD